MKHTYIVTGGLGFIGSHLVDALLDDPETKEVRVLDNYSSGKVEHLKHHRGDFDSGRLKIIRHDLTERICDSDFVISESKWFKGVDVVFHLSANPDARKGNEDTELDLRQEALATYHVLDAMRLSGVKKIIFSSSGTVYGDTGLEVCREGQGERLPISLYGAGKVASEALISAFCGTFGMKGVIFRFGNVIGERSTHGAVFDWLKQLREHHDHLTVLGDGNQSKPFVYVGDIVAGMLHGLKLLDSMKDGTCEAYNLAPDGATSVKFMATELVIQMCRTGNEKIRDCEITYGQTPQGWAGDVPHCRMDSSKLRGTGFNVTMSSDEAVKRGIEKILKTI